MARAFALCHGGVARCSRCLLPGVAIAMIAHYYDYSEKRPMQMVFCLDCCLGEKELRATLAELRFGKPRGYYPR